MEFNIENLEGNIWLETRGLENEGRLDVAVDLLLLCWWRSHLGLSVCLLLNVQRLLGESGHWGLFEVEELWWEEEVKTGFQCPAWRRSF